MATFRKRNERWEYRISYKDPFTQKYKLKSKGGFRTKPEAKLAAAKAELEIEEGVEQAPEALSTFLDAWLTEFKKGNVRKNTYQMHERNIEKHILPYFKNIRLVDVKPIMYQKFLNHLSNQDYSKRTIEIIHTTMNNAFEKAVILGKLKKNPCVGVTIKGKEKEPGLRFIETEYISRFLHEAYKYDYIYWIYFKVLIETGIRKGEAAALKWSDIDLKKGQISINKTLDFTATTQSQLFGNPKTYSSKRIVTISNSLLNDLHFHIKYQNQNKIALNEIYHHDLNLVLCRNDGNFMPKSSLFNAFERILKRADLPKVPIHSLRHTHAVLLLEAGADMKYVQDRLGHGSIQITSDVYAHISKKIEKDTMGKYEEYIKNVLN
jgi:integrase